MKKLVVRLVLLPILLIVAVFALSNRQPIELSLWPLPWDAQAPMFVVLLATLLIGILIGGGLVWTRGRRHRSAARAHRRTNERLQRQLDAMKNDAQKPRAGSIAPPIAASGAAPVVSSAPQIMPAQPANRAGSQPPPSFTPVNRAR